MPGVLRKVLMSAVVSGVLLGVINGLMFLGEYAAYGTWWADGQPVGLYESTSGDRPRLRAGARLDGMRYAISINAMGFRGPDPAEQKPGNALRIWCVGGSTTFDIFAPDDAHTWPAQLQSRLQEALPGRAVEVLNAGIPGEVLQGSAQDIQELAGAFKPDIVVVYHGPNDMRQTLAGPGQGMGGAGSVADGGGPGLGALLNQDLAAFRVLGRLLQSSQYLQVDLPDRELPAHVMKPIRGRLEDLIRRAEMRGAAVLLATHALRAAPDATGDVARRDVAETAMMLQMSAESSIRAFALYNEMVSQVAAEQGLVLADVRAAVPPDPALWGDATHFRAGGSALAADEIARAILDSPLVE